MNRKILISIGLALTLMLTVSGAVLAAPAAQETAPFTGTVQSITLETDPTTLETTVVVEVLDDTGATQTVRLSVEDAADPTLGLVTLDPVTGEPTVNDAAIGTEVSIDPALVIGDEVGEEAQHPVALVLSEFFGEDYDAIMDAHEEGVGFGVIAQALWMADKLEGTTFDEILDAKKNGEYPTLENEDGTTFTAENWGQFRKAIYQGDKKGNLGEVMSDKSEDVGEGEEGDGEEDTIITSQDSTTHGNNGANGKGNHKGKGKHKNH